MMARPKRIRLGILPAIPSPVTLGTLICLAISVVSTAGADRHSVIGAALSGTAGCRLEF